MPKIAPAKAMAETFFCALLCVYAVPYSRVRMVDTDPITLLMSGGRAINKRVTRHHSTTYSHR